jgi:hypothetical protein
LPKSLNFNNFSIETHKFPKKSTIPLTFTLLLLLLIGCKEHGVEPIPDIPIDELLQTPTTINVAGKSLFLKTFLSMDLMPGPERRPLYGAVYIITTDSSANTIFNFRRRRLDSL